MRSLSTLLILLALAGCASSVDEQAAVRTATTPNPPARATTAPEVVRPLPHPASSETSLGLMRRLAPKRAQVSPRLTAAAQDLSALAPTVFCWDTRGWRKAVAATNRDVPPEQRGEFAGITDLYSYEIHLAPWVCETLEALPDQPDDELVLADALDVLVHETRHLTGTGSNEAATECAALQGMPEAAVALGLDEKMGNALAHEAWQNLYPLLPDRYRTTGCRPGGALDEEPETPQFP